MNFHETQELLEKSEKDFGTDFIKKSSSIIPIENSSVTIKPTHKTSSIEFTNKSLIGSASYESSTVEICNDVNNITSKSTESAQEISIDETNFNNWYSAEHLSQESDFIKKSNPESYSKGEKSILGGKFCKSLTVNKNGVPNKEKTEISPKNVSKSYTISKEDMAYLKEKRNQDSCSVEGNSNVNATTDVSKSSNCKSIRNVSKNSTSKGCKVANVILNKVVHLLTPFGSNKELLSNSDLQKKPPLETRRSILKVSFEGERYVKKPYYQPYRDRLIEYPEKNAVVKPPLKSHDKKCGTDAKKLTYVPENLKFLGDWENTESFPENHPWFSWISDCENGFPEDVFKNPMVDKWTNTDEDLEKNYRENNLLGKEYAESSTSQIVSAEDVKKIPVKISQSLIYRVPSAANQKTKLD